MFLNSNLKGVLAFGAIALAPVAATADPAHVTDAHSPARVHVDLGLFDTVTDARHAWAEIIDADHRLLRFDPIFGRYQGQTTANVFFVPPTDAAAVCQAARRSRAETCKLFD